MFLKCGYGTGCVLLRQSFGDYLFSFIDDFQGETYELIPGEKWTSGLFVNIERFGGLEFKLF